MVPVKIAKLKKTVKKNLIFILLNPQQLVISNQLLGLSRNKT